jgi:hypothetical protein
MRKITLLLGCLIGLSGAVSAQDLQPSSDIDGLLDRLSQLKDNMGDVSSYFTQEEQSTLRNYFISQQEVALPAAYYNNSHSSAVIEGGVSNDPVNLNTRIPFTGTYYYPGNNATASLLYDNGPYYNVPGTPNVSFLQDATLGMGTYGFGAAAINGFSIADDVTFTDDVDITSIDVFAYQTGSPIGSINAISLQVWDGDPSGGSASIVWGDLTTNILDGVSDSQALRQLESAPGDTSRPIQLVTANTTGLSLTAGTYWIEYTFSGSGASGPWAPPIVITGTAATGNALQNNAGTYTPVIDVDAQGFPFMIYGDIVGGGGPAVVFGIDNTTTSLVSFDPADPTVLTNLGISPAVGFENAGAIDPNNNGTAYVLDNGGAFYSVDLASGVYTSLGNIAAPNGETWAGAEFDPTSGTLYAMSTNVTTSTLSTIDIAGVSATTVGMTSMAGAISLMIDGAGNAYSHDIVDDTFYSVDLTSGATTPIGSLGFDANFGQGGTYNPGDGFVYLSAFDNGSFQSQWRQVDVATGTSTVIGLFNGGADQVAWTSVQGGTVGYSDNALEGFAYYPNPTSDVLSLKSVNSIDSVAIFNLLGQRVLDTKVGATTSDISLSGLTAGTYIMKVTVAGQTGTYKVLKN